MYLDIEIEPGRGGSCAIPPVCGRALAAILRPYRQGRRGAPAAVADLGCGTGELTCALSERWPDVAYSGSTVRRHDRCRPAAHRDQADRRDRGDVSGGRSARPRRHGGGAPAATSAATCAGTAATACAGAGGAGCPPHLPRDPMLGDIQTWRPSGQVDVIVSNAVLAVELIARWASWLPSGGWLAFQVPGNFCQPSHQIFRELAASPRSATIWSAP